MTGDTVIQGYQGGATMQQPDAEWWARARSARDVLARRVLRHPAVQLVDIGLDPEGALEMPVLRVHLRPDREPPPLPVAVGGIPVRTVLGTYGLERG